MKLAEALQERADLNCKIGQLTARLEANARVQDGEKPTEDPTELLSELDACIARLEELTVRINKTNCQTVTDGVTLTELIAKKDCLNLKIRSYRDFAQEARNLTSRALRTEIKIFSTVDIPPLQKQIDDMSKELRLTDNRLQQANWTVDLL